MGYPTYAFGLRPVCMRVIRLKPISVLEPRADQKIIRVLVSELNPPLCAVIKEMAQGGTKGSVPISFASTATRARVCPPKPCPCKPCPKLTPFQKMLKKIILASKILFLLGSIGFMWYIGGFGPTWCTWNIKECVKNYYFACRNIKYIYKDKCNPRPEESRGPICYDTERPWNRAVIMVIESFNVLYFMIRAQIREILNYENCDYEALVKPKAAATKDAKKEKLDYGKIYRSLFSALDPVNIPCDDPPDYYAQSIEMMRNDD